MENNNVTANNNMKTPNESKSNTNWVLVIIIIILVILLGVAGYFLFIKNEKGEVEQPNNSQIQETETSQNQENENKEDGEIESQKQEENVNINYDILNYQCKEKSCDYIDYSNVKKLLNTNDTVLALYDGKDHKKYAILLESIDKGNRYLYFVNTDKYYFKNDNYYSVDIVANDHSGVDEAIYDLNLAVVHQRIKKHYENIDIDTANTGIYNFKNNKYVFKADEYYECSYSEYQNKRFYKLNNNGDSTLYDDKFNKVFKEDTYGNFAFDNKYIFGIIKENTGSKFFKYDIDNKKNKLSSVLLEDDGFTNFTYNYVVRYSNEEYEVCDFDGNCLFKINEKSYLKDIKTSEYSLPFIPSIYYSKSENKIKLIIEPDICGDSSCPPHFGYSYYEYDIKSKKITHKFFTDRVPDDIYKNLYDGYVMFNY